MRNPFRLHHILTILNGYEKTSYPLDLFLRNYFRKNKQLGSKDREFICHTLYEMIRKKGLIDSTISSPYTWEKRYHAFEKISEKNFLFPLNTPDHIRFSMPKIYYSLLLDAYGKKQTAEICEVLNQTAPITIRANTLKTTREYLFQQWEKEYSIKKCEASPLGISFQKRINFFGLEEFKKGFFEVQDEGSQLLASLIIPNQKDWVLDYCAGSGGKSLAIAASMKNKGQIFLHDIREHVLYEAKKRLKRAGVQNAQLLFPKKKKLQRLMDWVLVDAPCSGSGTLRRNPDMKWKFTLPMLERLVDQQREIFAEALNFLKPGGKIVFATCSIFEQENKNQVEYFLKHHPIKLIGEPLTLFPKQNANDGFFGAVFEKKILKTSI